MGSFFSFSELGDAYAQGKRFSSRPALTTGIDGPWQVSDEEAATYIKELSEEKYSAFQRIVARRASTEFNKINREGRSWKKIERKVADELCARHQARRRGEWE